MRATTAIVGYLHLYANTRIQSAHAVILLCILSSNMLYVTLIRVKVGVGVHLTLLTAMAMAMAIAIAITMSLLLFGAP